MGCRQLYTQGEEAQTVSKEMWTSDLKPTGSCHHLDEPGSGFSPASLQIEAQPEK